MIKFDELFKRRDNFDYSYRITVHRRYHECAHGQRVLAKARKLSPSSSGETHESWCFRAKGDEVTATVLESRIHRASNNLVESGKSPLAVVSRLGNTYESWISKSRANFIRGLTRSELVIGNANTTYATLFSLV